MERLHGSISEEVQRVGCKVAIHPEDLPKWLDEWRTLVASWAGGEIEARLRRHDGAYRWFPHPSRTLARRVGRDGSDGTEQYRHRRPKAGGREAPARRESSFGR